MSVRVVAPCRLHFGLFHVPVDGLTHNRAGGSLYRFGGLGLMIDHPCVTVSAEDATGEDSITGPLADRARVFVGLARQNRAMTARYETRAPDQRYRITAQGAVEHTGLGVGTALGMAVASSLLPAYWQTVGRHRHRASERLAEAVQRGLRSQIGVRGFQIGGFLADHGKFRDQLPELASRSEFPPAWRIVLVRPPVPPVWYGDRELSAFARTRPADRALELTEYLRQLAYDTVVPAVRDADFDTFAASIAEFNRMAGEPFVHDQGGPYAGAEVACVIDELIEMGAVGVGQSSWGPTVFAFCESEAEAEKLASKARGRFSSATEVTVTRANNTGARVEQL